MKPSRQSCEHCRELEAELAAVRAELQQVRELLAAAKKDSTTSSKPPSSDIAKPRAQPVLDGSKRTIGGQPGHPVHLRTPFAASQLTAAEAHELQVCPDCGGAVHPKGTPPRVVQQVDIGEVPLTIQQHTVPEYWCDHCRKACRATLPVGIERGGLVGPNLTALIALMKGSCHASFSTIRLFLRDVVGVTVARSTLANTLAKVSQALDGPYEELLRLLPNEPVLNVDETGHKCKDELWWTWCLRADLYTLFKIDPHRSADVLIKVLGREYEGVLGCDYFSAYRRFMGECGVTVQFCLAHLIRDVKFLTTMPDDPTRRYGESLRVGLKQLFETFHERDNLSAAEMGRRLGAARDHLMKISQECVPSSKHAQNMAKRFRLHGQSFFTFVTTPGVEPTNNLAEQAIRFVVIDRHITQGTRGEAGRRWSERIWTAIATCAGQGRSVHEYLKGCVECWFAGLPSPSLLV